MRKGFRIDLSMDISGEREGGSKGPHTPLCGCVLLRQALSVYFYSFLWAGVEMVR